jgi:hypothetical protein
MEVFLALLPAIASSLASGATLVVAVLALYQWWRATRWRQGEEGRKVVDDLFLSDKHGGTDALVMTDLQDEEPCPFEEPDLIRSKVKKTHQVSHKDVIEALKGSGKDPDKTAFIQGCFDDLFYYLERIDLFLENRFITCDDVRSPLAYYQEQMAKNPEDYKVYKAYIRKIRAGRADRFLKRLEKERRERKGFADAP